MDVREAYNNWACQYDTNQNKTRDLEAKSLRSALQNIDFNTCLEIGCGTGKNTEWLSKKAKKVIAVDLSEEMLAKAKEKILFSNVQFILADITTNWSFTSQRYDLITFSLVLEHISNLDFVFEEVSRKLNTGGYVYIGELHPFKQYSGSKARFDTEQGQQVVNCYTHHISEFIKAANKNGLQLLALEEYFDNNNQEEIPRILTLLLQKLNA
jgi:ubiquinone/menaquinone biosynthesis C-methylase UbiE